jgi:hypothetical protein
MLITSKKSLFALLKNSITSSLVNDFQSPSHAITMYLYVNFENYFFQFNLRIKVYYFMLELSWHFFISGRQDTPKDLYWPSPIDLLISKTPKIRPSLTCAPVF